MWGLSPTDEGIVSGFGLFDKLIIEKEKRGRRSSGALAETLEIKDFGGPVSSCSVKSLILHRI
jgi:hypothetical protein